MDSNSLLEKLLEDGIISHGDILKIDAMTKKEKVLSVHPYSIAQGKGKDTRWFTYVGQEKRKKVGKKTEEALILYLYDYYFGTDKSSLTVPELYPEWFKYKRDRVSRMNTLRRYDNDYKRFYENEPLTESLMQKPVSEIKLLDIESWAYAMIRKYNLSSKAYLNMMTPLRQLFDYLVKKEIVAVNIARQVRIDRGYFKPSRKKPAKTQIFFKDEEQNIIEESYRLAEETRDGLYLAFPFFFLSGIRIGELLGLSYEDLDEDSHTIHIHQSLMLIDTVDDDRNWGKTKYQVGEYLKRNADERYVVVPEECFRIAERVQNLQKEKGLHARRIFPVTTPTNLQKKLTRICRNLNIIERSPHKIRKTYISTLINHMMDLDFVREQVGHKELQTTLNSYTYSTTRTEKQFREISEIFKS